MVKPVSLNFGSRKTSIFYVNDIHGQTDSMPKILEASEQFDKFEHTGVVDKIKLASGDTILGSDKELNYIASKFLDFLGLDATAVGNHEFDAGAGRLYNLMRDKQCKVLALNMQIDKNNPLSNIIEKFTIIKKNGMKYGIIGLSPIDLFKRVANNDNRDFSVDNLENTIVQVQKSVDKLHSLGIDKIIVVSHLGNENERKLAKSTSGIDVILGGHSHDLIKGVKKDENLLYGKDGKPVIITQAGKDGNYYGILNLEFDDNGVIIGAENSVIPTQPLKSNSLMSALLDKVLGKPEIIGTITSSVEEPSNRLVSENPHAGFVADAIKTMTNGDMSMITAGSIRDVFDEGVLDTRKFSNILPFKSNIIIAELSEQTIIEALKTGAKSLVNPGFKPGLLQVSGLNYKVNSQGNLVSAYFIDKQKNKNPLNIIAPSSEKKFRVAMDTYLASGADGFTMLNCKNSIIKNFAKDKNSMVIDYIKSLISKNDSVNIACDKRIEIVP